MGGYRQGTATDARVTWVLAANLQLQRAGWELQAGCWPPLTTTSFCSRLVSRDSENRTAVAIDAFLHQMMADSPVPDTGSAADDFRLALRGMMRLYASPFGAIYAQLVGEAQFYPTARARIRTHQVNLRRAAVTKIWDRGVARGELDPNVDPAVALDLIFGAAVYRMATGHGALTPDDADAIVATAMRALAS